MGLHPKNGQFEYLQLITCYLLLLKTDYLVLAIGYLLDVYYTRLEVGCQVDFNHGFRGFSRICISHREHRGHRGHKG